MFFWHKSAFLLLPLIQEGLLSGTKVYEHKVLVTAILNPSWFWKSVVMLTGRLDMTIAIDWDVNHTSNKKKIK